MAVAVRTTAVLAGAAALAAKRTQPALLNPPHLQPLPQAVLVNVAHRAFALARRQQLATICIVRSIIAHAARWLRRWLGGSTGWCVGGGSVGGGGGRGARHLGLCVDIREV